MNNNYYRWLYGDCNCGCQNNYRQIEDCDCEQILLDISNIHTDINVLQEEIDDIDLSNYYTKTEVDALIPSLSGYATEEWVINQGYLTDADLSDYALKSEIPVVPTNVSSFINDAGYLTDHTPLKTINGQAISGSGNITIEASGGTVDVDSTLDPTSTNPVENKAIVEALNGKLDASAYTPTDLSNYVTKVELIQYITNLQQQIDSLQAAVSGCCGETGETTYRWVVMTGENDYLCSGTTKMTKEKKQQSSDGITWTDVVPAEYRMGDTVLEENSVSCGYVPPTPTPTGNTAFMLNYSGDTNIINTFNENADCNWINGQYIVMHQTTDHEILLKSCSHTFDCDEFTEVNTPYEINVSISGTSSIIPDGFYADTDLIEGNVLTGCSRIGNYAFSGCSKMKTFSIGIPNGFMNMPRIVNGNVETYRIECSASTKVQSIGNYAFKNCATLEAVEIYCADVVPTLGTGAFDGCTSLRAIIVPSSMLNDFKTASGWSQYASIIVGDH